MADIDFEKAWSDYYSRIAYYVGRLFPSLRPEVEDVVQETFARAFAASRPCGEKVPAAPWLYATARNLCIDRLRTASRRGESSLDAGGAEAEDRSDWANPVERTEADQRRRAVGEAIRSLPPADRELCYLYYFENLSVREIGRVIGRPTGTVKYRLFRVRARLREKLEGRLEG